MSKNLTQQLLTALKSFKNQQEYKVINKELDRVIKFLSKNDIQAKLPLFEKLVYSLKTIPKIYFLSILLYLKLDSKYFNDILKIILQSDTLPLNTRFFVLYQCVSIWFTNKNISNDKTRNLIWDCYEKIYNSYKSQLSEHLKFIPKQERNDKLIFVLTSQFLSLNHGPSKSALDRAYCLKQLGYEIIIINTAEIMSQAGAIPFEKAMAPNYMPEYQNMTNVDYLDTKLPYFQCSDNMPNIEEIMLILNVVNQHKPYLIFSLGSYNIAADICSNIVPVGDITMVPSSLPVTFSQFHITGRPITKDDIEFASEYGFCEDNLIFNLFTSAFKPQNEKYTRADFNLPEDKFILTFVGGRLSKEVDDDMIKLMLKTVEFGTYLIFVGDFDIYDSMCQKHKDLKDNSSYLGTQDDMLAVLELCDLYINPKRTGGGTSAVEALHKEVPVVTYNFGDVYINVGDDFTVTSDEELLETIKRYIDDKEFYKNQVKKGLQKCKELTDTKESIRILVEKIENNPLFK